MNYRYKRYMMRKIRREIYKSYRKSSNDKTVPRKRLNNSSVSGTEAFIIWMIIIFIVGFFVFAFTI